MIRRGAKHCFEELFHFSFLAGRFIEDLSGAANSGPPAPCEKQRYVAAAAGWMGGCGPHPLAGSAEWVPGFRNLESLVTYRRL